MRQVYKNDSLSETPDIPFGCLALGAIGFLLGILIIGSKTISTVGTKITKLTPSKSFSTQIGAAVAVLASSVVGMPVSTSHCLVRGYPLSVHHALSASFYFVYFHK